MSDSSSSSSVRRTADQPQPVSNSIQSLAAKFNSPTTSNNAPLSSKPSPLSPTGTGHYNSVANKINAAVLSANHSKPFVLPNNQTQSKPLILPQIQKPNQPNNPATQSTVNKDQSDSNTSLPVETNNNNANANTNNNNTTNNLNSQKVNNSDKTDTNTDSNSNTSSSSPNTTTTNTTSHQRQDSFIPGPPPQSEYHDSDNSDDENSHLDIEENSDEDDEELYRSKNGSVPPPPPTIIQQDAADFSTTSNNTAASAAITNTNTTTDSTQSLNPTTASTTTSSSPSSSSATTTASISSTKSSQPSKFSNFTPVSISLSTANPLSSSLPLVIHPKPPNTLNNTTSASNPPNPKPTTDENDESVLHLLPPKKLNLTDYSLNSSLSALFSDNNGQLQSQISSLESKMDEIRYQIVQSSRKNFILERELNEIDEKIKLLIKNKIQIQEVMSGYSHHELNHNNNNTENSTENELKQKDVLKGKKQLYEELFYFLQSNPAYLADLARLLSANEIPSIVQTVVFDLYGDQYDSREERLLLTLFRRAIKAELESCTDKGSLLRSNTALTVMLSAYARRGQGLSILKDILEKPLKSLVKQSELNLEINPSKVYIELIQEFETSTGKASEWNKSVTDEEAAQKAEVIEVVKKRVDQLTELCEDILQRIINGVETIPYGMRWICKQLAVLYKQKFPDSDRYQCGSLVGGYIYLRFFNPVIVNPQGVNFVPSKPSKTASRNLILIAKVLQNLSNGLLFGDKEFYMKPLNQFIQNNLNRLQDYFDSLINVDDVEDELIVDKYLEHIQLQSGNSNIQISLNQIIQIHSLLKKHLLNLVKNPEKSKNDSVLKVLVEKLGNAPEELSREENRVVNLTLNNPVNRENRLSSTAGITGNTGSIDPRGTIVLNPNSSTANASPSQLQFHPMVLQAKSLLLSLLRKLSPNSASSHSNSTVKETNIREYLLNQKQTAVNNNNKVLADEINNVLSMLSTLVAMNLLPNTNNATPAGSSTTSASNNNNTNNTNTTTSTTATNHNSNNLDEVYNVFLWNCASDSISRLKSYQKLSKSLGLASSALTSIKTHHEYLISRLELYKIYLENAREGQALQNNKSPKSPTSPTSPSSKLDNNSTNNNNKSNSSLGKIVRFGHSQLEDNGVVTYVSPNVQKSVLKKCQYTFQQISIGVFRVDLVLKKGPIEISLLGNNKHEFVLEDLLKLQESGQLEMEVDVIKLNVNLIIHLLNTNFMKK